MAPSDASSKARPVGVGSFTFKWIVTGLVCSVLVVAGLVWAQAKNAQSPPLNSGSKTASGDQPANQSASLNNTPQVQAKPTIQLSPAIQQRESIKPRS